MQSRLQPLLGQFFLRDVALKYLQRVRVDWQKACSKWTLWIVVCLQCRGASGQQSAEFLSKLIVMSFINVNTPKSLWTHYVWFNSPAKLLSLSRPFLRWLLIPRGNLSGCASVLKTYASNGMTSSGLNSRYRYFSVSCTAAAINVQQVASLRHQMR